MKKRNNKKSAGLLMYRFRNGVLQVLLGHPGGPFWAGRDEGVWSLPKGEYSYEDPFSAAQREFYEETGLRPAGDFIFLGSLTQPSGKRITAWAFEGDCNPETLSSNTFTMEWPPDSGRRAEFPEIDRSAWFEVKEACRKISRGQREFIQRLSQVLEQ